MSGVYCITCKPEYWNTWVAILKDGLVGFATVEILYPIRLRTIPKNVNSIASPSGNFSVNIGPIDYTPDDDGCNVYVVSEGGYLHICELFNEDKSFIDIMIGMGKRAKRVNKKIYHEMYNRTTLILDKMHIDYRPPD
jgi:hypothetical protein